MLKTLCFTLLTLAAALASAQPDPYEPDNQQAPFITYGTAVDRSLEPDINVTGIPDVDRFDAVVRSGETANFTISNLGSELPPTNIQIVVTRVYLNQRIVVAANNPASGITSVTWTEPLNPFGPALNMPYEIEVYEVEPMATGPNAGYRASFNLVSVVASPALSSMSFASSTVKGGNSVNATATLTMPAPIGGAVVNLAYSGPISGPATVTVPAGATSVTFSVSSKKVNKNTAATLSGAYGQQAASASITVTK